MRASLKRNTQVIVLEVEPYGPNGVHRVNMVLETGATFTMMPWAVAEHLGYEPAVSRSRITLTTASTIETVPMITIERMKVLGAEAEGVDVVVHDLPPKSRVDGLLGLSFLRRFNKGER
jgi:clan AA aspartic protease (TIGR02281 family)